MNKILLIFLLISNVLLSFSQEFSLESDTFSIGAIYNPEPAIMFDYDKSTISPRSFNQLDKLATFLIQHEHLVIEIGTHTDSRGSIYYSRRLDLQRSESIADYLMTKGIDSERLIAKGYRSTQPIITDKTISSLETLEEREKAHQTNRRTEFKIVDMNSKIIIINKATDTTLRE